MLNAAISQTYFFTSMLHQSIISMQHAATVKHISFISMLNAAISEAYLFYIDATCCYQWNIFLLNWCYTLLSVKHISFISMLHAAVSEAYYFYIDTTCCYQRSTFYLYRCYTLLSMKHISLSWCYTLLSVKHIYFISMLHAAIGEAHFLYQCYMLLSVEHISFTSMLHAAISETYFFYIDATRCYRWGTFFISMLHTAISEAYFFKLMLHAVISETYFIYIDATRCYQWSIFLFNRRYTLLSVKHISFTSMLHAAISEAYFFYIDATRCYQWSIYFFYIDATCSYQWSIFLLYRCYTLLSVKHITFKSMLHAVIMSFCFTESYNIYISADPTPVDAHVDGPTMCRPTQRCVLALNQQGPNDSVFSVLIVLLTQNTRNVNIVFYSLNYFHPTNIVHGHFSSCQQQNKPNTIPVGLYVCTKRRNDFKLRISK